MLLVPSPPGYYIDDNYELQTCTVGQYCNLGRSANSATIDKLNCPALTYCPDPSIIEPTLCSCNSSYCSYCTNGSNVEIPCPKGYYCRVDVLNKQPLKIACKPGYYCPENSIYQQICPPRYYCPTPAEIYECPGN